MEIVAIQGIAGSFHHEAALKMLGDKINLLPCATFQQVFEAVRLDRADFGVVAIENSIYGSINAVYRQLSRNTLWVSKETKLLIDQYLIGAKSINPNKIKKVLSQNPAIAQCELWLLQNMPSVHIEETHDTAQSVRFVVEHKAEPIAAIASKFAAQLYGGTIIAGPIQDYPDNYTRFFLIGKNKEVAPDATKTSIILETNHKPAALYSALGIFAKARINLSKLDSHPIANDKSHYAFYIDFDSQLDERIERDVFEALHSQGCNVTVLGSYNSIN